MFTASYTTAAKALSASPAMRTMALLTLINALGNGLFAAISILFYTQHLGLPIPFVSLALLIATLLAIGGDLLSGRITDASSPKPVLLSGLLLSASATAALLPVQGEVTFVIVLCLISLGQGLCMSSNTALIRRLARGRPGSLPRLPALAADARHLRRCAAGGAGARPGRSGPVPARDPR